MTVVGRFKRESTYGLSAKKVAVVERWALVEFRLFNNLYQCTRLENKRSTHGISHKNVNPKIALKPFKVVCQYDSRVACERLIPVCGHCPTYYQAIVWFVLLIFCSTYWERFRQRNALVGTWKWDKRENLVDSNNVTAPHRGGASRKTVYEIKNLPWHKGTPTKTTSTILGMRSPMLNAINYWFDWELCAERVWFCKAMDLFSSHVLFSHCRQHNVTPENSFIQISRLPPAYACMTNWKTKGQFPWEHHVVWIGDLHDDAILLLWPESFRVLLSCAN